MPPITPEPSHISHKLMDVDADGAEDTRPPAQQHAATTPALRGPTRSSQPPQIAAETPSRTKNRVYIQPMLAMRQSQVVVKSSCKNVMSGHALGCVIPSARDNGSQNTLKNRTPCRCTDGCRAPPAEPASD